MEQKTYKVTIDFKRGPSFSQTVSSYGASGAKAAALTFARGCGYNEAVRKSVAAEEVAA